MRSPPRKAGATDRLLTSTEVAELLRVHPKHIYRLLRRGMPARRAGGKWLFSREEVLRWAEGSDGRAGAAPTVAPPAQASWTGTTEPLPVLAGDDDLVVEVLIEQLRQRGQPLLGFLRADRAVGIELVAMADILVAGWHGRAPPPRLGVRLARLHLAEREVGFLLRSGLRLSRIEEAPGLRVAGRPPTSGLHEVLDAALRSAGLERAALGTAALLASNLEVAAAIVRGEADLGLAPRTWAERFGLEFFSLGYETYELLVPASRLGDPHIVRLCEVAQSAPLREALAGIPGYRVARTGELRIEPE
ncbi:MAG: substrate-binding domain-containing protein [Myxococcales bacterium]|jgi:putative molybdopterin biosynthesis protein